MVAGPQQLLARLDRIGAVLRDSGHALALIGLGSAGLERERLDEWSDLDFFVIAEPSRAGSGASSTISTGSPRRSRWPGSTAAAARAARC